MERALFGVAGLVAAQSLIGAAALAREPGQPQADLPPLLRAASGEWIRTPAEWPQRRAEIATLLCQHIIGSFPEGVPPLLRAEVREESVLGDGTTRRRVELTFGTPKAVSLPLAVWLPAGAGPFPLLLVAPRFYQIPWAEQALARGYAVCLFPGIDSHHQEADYPGFESAWTRVQAEYPAATWTEISTKAWLASRMLDYLLDPRYGYPLAPGQVGIIGHSRYGKQALIAAAFDERITCVVARSPGTPASCAYRFASRTMFAEAPDDWPDQWFLQSLRAYTGREHELPIDSHGWLALIAPRRCLIHSAHQDDGDPTFGVERTVLQGRTVYELLGCPENLRLLYRSGGHDPITDAHRRANLDWFDLSFGRGTARQADFPEEFIHRFDWTAWRARLTAEEVRVPVADSHSSGDPAARRARVLWSLGRPPAGMAETTDQHTFLTAAESEQMTHDRWQGEGTTRLPANFGENVRGNLYFNPALREPAAAVIWLHPYSYGSGYNEGYGVLGTTIYHRLAKAGYVVLCFDQLGFGLRLLEGCDFYDRHPQWSRLGRMVHDVQAAVDFLVDGKGHVAGSMPAVRPDKVFVLGYSLGGLVGLYATALDNRIAGLASFCGFTPLRTDTDAKQTGGIRRLWEWYALQPLLGLFDGHEQDIPFDVDDLLRQVAPRPCLVVAARRDRHADVDDVTSCVEAARDAWPVGSARGLVFETPDTINHFQTPMQERALEWLRRQP
jgi:dienelactone hydrolase